MKRIYIIISFVTILCGSLYAQVGTEFWFAAPELALHSRDMSYRLYLFAEAEATDVTVSMPAESSFSPITVHVDEGGYQEIMLAKSYEEYMNTYIAKNGSKGGRGLYISSKAPISAYVQMTGVNGEAYALKGDNALGIDFYVSQQNLYTNCIMAGEVYEHAFSSVQIVATEDSTEVTIEPTVGIGFTASRKPIVVMLNRGETYAFRASSKDGALHLTGTHITSTKPIVVNSTDDSMAPHPKIYGEDLAADQILPAIVCGTDYIAIGRGLSWEGLFVTALEDNTIVSFIGQSEPVNGEVTTVEAKTLVLAKNQTQFVPLGKTNAAVYLHASKDVQVFQISGYHNEAGATQLPSLYRSGSKQVQYVRLADSKYMNVHILTPTTNIAHITCNDELIDSTMFIPLQGNKDWSYAVIDASMMPLGKRIQFRSSKDVFHLGVIDATSILKPNKQGKIIMTSCTYGYFSSYYTPEMDIKYGREVIPPLAGRKDTLKVKDSLSIKAPSVERKAIPEDTVIEQDSTKSLQHHFAIYMEGGYAHLPAFVNDVKWGTGYGAGAGLLYELQKEHFIFDIGAGFLWEKSQHKMPITEFQKEYIDTQNAQNTLVYSIKRSDWTQIGQVDIPILFGGSWKHVYLLGGIKIGVPVWGRTDVNTSISNIAIYNQYWVPLSQMDNHGLRFDVPENRVETRLDYKLDTRLSFEFGFNIGPDLIVHNDTIASDSLAIADTMAQTVASTTKPSKVRCRLGVFADMGALWPIQSFENMPLCAPEDAFNYSTWQLNHVLKSDAMNERYIHNFMVGIKFTVLFNATD